MPNHVTLSFRQSDPGPVDLSGIVPDRFAELTEREIAALPVWVGRASARLGDICTVKGEKSADVRIEGELRNLDCIGAGMHGGRLTVLGDAGRDVGRGMAGGLLEVSGSVRDGCGVGMSGGSIKVAGSAGDGVGGASPGASRGMSGGEIFVAGSVGRGAGASARRGLVVVGGDAGDGTAHSMIAGTVLVFGALAGSVGRWNKRGTVVALGGASVPATYWFACSYRPVFLRVLLAYLRASHGVIVEDRFVTGRYARYCGDLSELGKGELLTWTGP
jgi:formylmethanofuran dehydrogenase subunit C